MNSDYLTRRREQRARASGGRASKRSSIFDPVVLAAVVGLLSGTVIKVADEIGESGRTGVEQTFEEEQKRCDRAYGYLQDNTLHPSSESDTAFYELNRTVAEECALKDMRKPSVVVPTSSPSPNGPAN